MTGRIQNQLVGSDLKHEDRGLSQKPQQPDYPNLLATRNGGPLLNGGQDIKPGNGVPTKTTPLKKSVTLSPTPPVYMETDFNSLGSEANASIHDEKPKFTSTPVAAAPVKQAQSTVTFPKRAPLAPPEESDITSTDTCDASWATIGAAYPELKRVYTQTSHVDQPQVL